ncbi:SLATT domain-containing protein [Ferribacterium limneticum]|uniref:SLATT domain-containing protein n=1 Tax=Ferribacterium limneticum TaxID=76259 RepID=UPI001CFB1431|nr:SLATT domain-containing protein [Ferribacterium limneticum]UCV17925.1 SLATT domain-containing protein [Ferribacterium limneticum]
MAPPESTRYTPPTNDAELVLAWLRRARESQFFHYNAAKRLGRYGRVFGVPVIVITAIVGASAFASILSQTVPLYAKLIVGLCSLVATVLSSLQTFFKFSERSEKHRIFGAKFGAVRRELETLHIQAQIKSMELAAVRAKLDMLAEEAPDVDAAVFSREKAKQGDELP